MQLWVFAQAVPVRYHCIQSAMNSAGTAVSARRPGLSRARRTVLLKALADPKRFELLERLAKAPCALSCSALKPALAISPATLSHHLKELETAGLISVRREGKFHMMSLRPGALDALMASLERLRQESCAQPPEISE